MADIKLTEEMPEWNKIYEKVNLVSSVSREVWIKAGKLYSIRNLEYGDFFVKQGSMATEIAFVFSGILREYYLTDKGNEYIKSFNFPGEFTGSYFDLLSGQPSTCNIRAITDCKLAVAKFSEFRDLFQTDIVWERLGRKFAENLFLKKARREYELLAFDAEKRYESMKRMYPNIEESVPQYHIASYLGITPVSLSRMKSKIKKAPESRRPL